MIWSNPFDNAIAIAFSSFFDKLPDFFKEFIVAFTNLCDNGIFLLVIGVLLILIKQTRKLGFFCLVGVLLTLIFNDLIFKNIFDRARPFEDENLLPHLIAITNNGGQVYGTAPTSNSFPSGHTFMSFCTFGGLLFYYIFKKDERKFYLPIVIFFGIFAFLMGISRVLVSHHYMTDVIAGALLGFGFGYLNYLIINYSPKLYYLIKDKYISKNKENSQEDNSNK